MSHMDIASNVSPVESNQHFPSKPISIKFEFNLLKNQEHVTCKY